MTGPRKRPDRVSFVEAMQTGASLLQTGRAQEALPHLKHAFQLAPTDVDAAINLGGAYVMLNRPNQAIPVLEKAADLDPENSKIWINLGAAYLGNPILATSEKQMRAVTAYEKALELDPAAPSVNYNVGLIFLDQGDVQAAIAQFRRAAAINPLDRDARSLLTKLEQRSKNEAERDAPRALGDHNGE